MLARRRPKATLTVFWVRTRSVSQGSTVIHNYTYASGKLLQETMASGAAVETLDFSYDESGAPYHLRYTNGAGSTWSYQYLCNLQGDVIGLLNSTGDLVARYVYDAWGRPISITDGKGKDVSGDPSHIANRNPLRYRGYYYDRVSGFYYLQSRYYDPVLCRFINADSFASTGQDFLGYNMFAYCNNNPVCFYDSEGTLPEWIVNMWEDTKQYVYGMWTDFKNYNPYNTDRKTVYDSHYFSNYKGVLVIRHSIKGLTSAGFGIIVFNRSEKIKNDPYALDHEYGHCRQVVKYGFGGFLTKVAIPSIIGCQRSVNMSLGEYYAQPWESEADQLGGVLNRKPSPGGGGRNLAQLY